MFEHFTNAAITVALQAQEEARRLRHNFVGSEQLLLGIIKENNSTAAKVLAEFGLNLANVRTEVESIIGRGSTNSQEEIPFTPKVKQVFSQAFQEARKLDHPYIEPEHLLLSLTQNSASVAYRVIANLRADPKKIRVQLIRMIEGLEETTLLVVRRTSRIGRCYIEPISVADAISLQMVFIPGGHFIMGSLDDDSQRYDSEGPQHKVVVSPFFMGRYPITQTQWRFVATLPQVERKLDPDPSNFKGDNHPVEQVSWWDATEFCDRLAKHTDRPYRLPSEAEWEYACRARTTKPFYFGPTLTKEVANYASIQAFQGQLKESRDVMTTPVDHFGIANAFGLSDMHGNVAEWCADQWHASYEGAPIDGSAWIGKDGLVNRVTRGGSAGSHQRACRSASRDSVAPEIRNDPFVGFRVSCNAPSNQSTRPWLERVRAWAEADADGVLSAIHISNHSAVTAQLLILRRLPPEIDWNTLSAEYGISVGALSTFYQEQCLPRMRAFGQSQNYF